MSTVQRQEKTPAMRKSDAHTFTLRPAIAKWSALLMSCVLGAQAVAQPASRAPTLPAQPPGASAAAPATTTPAATATPAPFKADLTYTLEQLGAQYPLNLRGIDGSNTLAFSVRNDEVVTGARLDVRYTYSPALLADISHINVLVNDEVAATIPVPKETAGVNLQRTVDIPPYLITAFSNLRLQLIGHYTMNCEDPLHSSLWANISNQSKLELATSPVQLPDDLARLPEPFFDRRDARTLQLPFVFAAAPDTAMLEAAGAVSSWFGALASYRGARFPATVAQLPAQGNAVVFAVGATAPGVSTPLQGPTLAVTANPTDPNGKLLVVMGRNAQELKQAANALVTGSQTLTGPSATITQFADLQARKPYDAPKWLRTDRPVSFGELIDAKRLNVSGYSPDIIRMDVRVPPDLFGWRENKVPVNLHYRYTPQPTSVNSSLLFSVDNQFVKSIPLFALEKISDGETLRAQVLPDESLPMQAQIEVPLELLKSRSQLQFRYMYDYIKQGECRDIIIDNVRGAIDPESTIDVSGYPHFIAMPNLAAFTQAGFPFTRMADLSETAVVLGSNAGAQEYGAYLTVMGRMGESTGYPATGVTVVKAQQASTAPADKDLLVIASGADQAWLKDWAARMPAAYENSGRFAVSDLVYRVLGWFHIDPRQDEQRPRTALAYTSSGVSAVVAGFESPRENKRSVVLIASNQPEGLQDATSALIGGKDYEHPIQGSLAIIRGKQVDSLVGEHQYYVGTLSFFKRIDWWLSSINPNLTLAGLIIGMLIALAVLAFLLSLLRRKPKSTP
ncbi:cellulose biosynthesis cyclic di-GMP-binding regulatory protein BcsB [Bordetella sp. LUAb4]|uniref:cellulose biosynthesis cyclic di-GMP-binding regulatory protein BcsB n=1 Tax=Bordetella sp. LUAb4 TaxID=2843195 RepID=UPI001E3C6D4E|nr:cellulose biosynthesis cyclic di-GMP-binding regulatory protein BcsB [Bordetella sp. LUAb4]